MWGLTKNIFHRLEWLWILSDSLMIYSIPIILIWPTNINVALIYSFKIWEQKTKNYAHSGSFQHKTAAPLFLQLMFAAFQSQSPLPTMETGTLSAQLVYKWVKVSHRGRASTCKTFNCFEIQNTTFIDSFK